MSERNHRGHLVLPDRFDCKNWYIARHHSSPGMSVATEDFLNTPDRGHLRSSFFE